MAEAKTAKTTARKTTRARTPRPAPTAAPKPVAPVKAREEQFQRGAVGAVYASIGAGQALFDKARELSGRVMETAMTARTRREETMKSVVAAYEALVKRGEKVASGIRTSGYTKAALDQRKAAEEQVKAAAAGIRKAVDAAATATREAAKRLG